VTIRPRRSMLYMPGSNARAIEKARTLPVDGIIIDLEDAVAPDAKLAARAQVVDVVRGGGFGGREVLIRINGLDTEWSSGDLTAAAEAAPDGILVPKILNSKQLELIGQRLLDMSTPHKTRIWAMIEMPFALLNIRDIAHAAADSEPRLAGFVLGTNDLAKETRARLTPGRPAMQPWLSICVAAARAYNLDILDGVYNDITDLDGFQRECEQARDFGFDGKTLVHPNQIGPCNQVFSPSPEEVAQARRIIAAFELPENRERGVVMLEGRMVERMHADMARRTVAIAEAVGG
jgi:citrate lyase subunit beta/citryl-CoA lyase